MDQITEIIFWTHLKKIDIFVVTTSQKLMRSFGSVKQAHAQPQTSLTTSLLLMLFFTFFDISH